jgi:hypothetical protein
LSTLVKCNFCFTSSWNRTLCRPIRTYTAYYYVFRYSTTSEHQMWRVMVLRRRPDWQFGLLQFHTSSLQLITIIITLLQTYTAYSLTRQYSILDIFTYSHLKILLLTACRHVRLETQLLIKVKVTLRLTASQSVSLGVEPHFGLMTRYLVLFDSCGLVFLVGRPLWREGGSVVYQSHCLH